MKTIDVTDLPGNQPGGGITNTGNAEKIRAKLVHVSLNLYVVAFDSARDMFHLFNSIQQLKGIMRLWNTDGGLCGCNQLLSSAFASAVQERGNLTHIRFRKSFWGALGLENRNGRPPVNVAEQGLKFRKDHLDKAVYRQFCFSQVFNNKKSFPR